MTDPDVLDRLLSRVQSLADNYATRAAHMPNPPARWADVAADLDRLLMQTRSERDDRT